MNPGNYEIENGTADARADLRPRRRHPGRARAQGGHPRRLVGPILTADEIERGWTSTRSRSWVVRSARRGVIVIDDRCCMVQLGISGRGVLQHESCGKCTPCREGTRWMTQILRGSRRATRSRPISTCCSTSATGSSASACARSGDRGDRGRELRRASSARVQAHIDAGRLPVRRSSLDDVLAPVAIHRIPRAPRCPHDRTTAARIGARHGYETRTQACRMSAAEQSR